MMRDIRATLYSDSDGVITDFILGAERILGHKWNWDSSDELNRSQQVAIMNQHEMFWETLPEMPDWKVYWHFIEKYDPHILTAVPQWDHDFNAVDRGKREWYRQHIPSLLPSHIHVVRREDKALFATNGDVRNILIDDHIKNVKEFEDAGGIGILHHNAKTTIIQLKALGYY